MKVTSGCEQIFHHPLHIYHKIWAKSDKGSEHNATERLLIPSKSAQGRPHHFLGCKWNYIYLCTNILFSVSLSFLLLHHHSSLGIGVEISCKYCYSCTFKYPGISRLSLRYVTQISHYFWYFLLIKDHSWHTVGDDNSEQMMLVKPHFEEQCSLYNYTFLWTIFQKQTKWDNCEKSTNTETMDRDSNVLCT
jgi:hypothetical protein